MNKEGQKVHPFLKKLKKCANHKLLKKKMKNEEKEKTNAIYF